MSRSASLIAASLLIAWLILLGVLSTNGFFSNFSTIPPRLSFSMLVPLVAVLVFVRSRTGKAFLRQAAPQWLIYLQSFRILVEAGLWLSVRNGMLPEQMSFEGRNFDIITGLLAIPVGYFCFVKRTWPAAVALWYNLGGLVLLLNAVALAVLSMPTPFRLFTNMPDASVLTRFPGIYLPGLLVPMAFTLHIFSLRRMGLDRRSAVTQPA